MWTGPGSSSSTVIIVESQSRGLSRSQHRHPTTHWSQTGNWPRLMQVEKLEPPARMRRWKLLSSRAAWSTIFAVVTPSTWWTWPGAMTRSGGQSFVDDEANLRRTHLHKVNNFGLVRLATFNWLIYAIRDQEPRVPQTPRVGGLRWLLACACARQGHRPAGQCYSACSRVGTPAAVSAGSRGSGANLFGEGAVAGRRKQIFSKIYRISVFSPGERKNQTFKHWPLHLINSLTSCYQRFLKNNQNFGIFSRSDHLLSCINPANNFYLW